jgi:uncharacterized protein (TIGR02145 family)
VITISGTPTATGSSTYTIPLTGGCGSVNATGTITVTVFTCGTTTVSDIDGNTYNAVAIIGTSSAQCWMSENLKTSRYRNGDIIPIVTDNTQWKDNSATGKRSWYNNDSTTHENLYGNLYNWYAVADSRGLCPTGWHVPNDTEWYTLTTNLGNNPGGQMKAEGLTYWNSPNTGATNSSGFSALPGGFRNGNNGNFENKGNFSYFWSSTTPNDGSAWLRHLNYDNGDLSRADWNRKDGVSVRCLKDY